MIGKILKWTGLAIVCLAAAALACGLLYRQYLRHQAALQRVIASPKGINSLEAVRIGNIDQWIQVRGQDARNPILLVIHGGPGVAFIPLARAFQRPWEKYFTVVEWDQRGAGKTYASNDKDLQRRTMTVAQMEQDTVDVVNYLRRRYGRDKIVVLGHSWGSVLGLWLAHEHPELIDAYVGVGQLVNTERNDEIAYRDALQQARDRHNAAAVKELESLAPFSNADFRKSSIARGWETDLLSPPSRGPAFTDVGRLLTDLFAAPEYSLADDFGFIRGQSASLNILVPQLAKLDFRQLGPDFGAPVFFFEGRSDPYCRPALIWEYSQQIRAPHKDFVWFEKSGHFPFFEEPEKFNEELMRRVLPLAVH